jgi:hypothetical protein
MSWLSKRLKPSKKAKKWWNKNVKPLGKKTALEAIGTPLSYIPIVKDLGGSALACSRQRGAAFDACVENPQYYFANVRKDPNADDYYQSDSPAFTEGQIGQGYQGNMPTHTGIDVTTGWTPTTGMTQAEYQAIVDQYTDNTTFGDEGAPPPPSPATTTSGDDNLKRSKPWLYAVSEKGDSNLLSLINQMLKDPEPKKMAMGGPIGMDSMMPSRRMYGKRKKPVMQTSTAGMPMRGMNAGIPMMKQGGMTKKYHI